MGRRSDHSRAELEALILGEGHALMASVGFARFSAREVAKRAGYTIGTIYNVFGSYDRLVLAINTRTFTLWAEHLRAQLAGAGTDRIAALVHGYFGFARAHPHLWMAIYDHRLPPGAGIPAADEATRAELTGIVADEIARALGRERPEVAALTRSLVATVHGHCHFALTGAFALMGEPDPEGVALARVRETLSAAAAG
ncbi:TetR/AcrR family transcriptional regulator [Sphingomonas sp.]|uniref:TetR/AcrR family transcriptional regulator n=1 Tax=Sphingomonas sp. TaxID=28214 RepID=UPI003CC60D85